MAGKHQQQQVIHWLPASWTVGLMSIYLGITAFIGENVPDSYMDEPFHVPMTQLYCKGDFTTWDPKITTFPGLYVIGAAYAWASKLLASWAGLTLEFTCSGPYLRSINALLAVATLQLAYAVSRELQRIRTDGSSSSSSSQQQQQQQQHEGAVGIALVVGLLPTQLFFAFLFYTDVPSLLFLLLTELLLLRRNTYAAAAAGAAAIGMRQTNAVWVTFLAGAGILRDVLEAVAMTAAPKTEAAVSNSTQSSSPKGEADDGGQSASETAAGRKQPSGQKVQQQQAPGVLRELFCLLCSAWTHRWSLLRDYCLLLVLPVAFCAFVVLNGGITLGDREAHAPATHLMQPLYFALFCLGSAAPVLLQPAVVKRVHTSYAAAPVLWVVGISAACLAAGFCVAKYSLVHPYLIADNRHYTFYLWRKVFTRHALLRYCFVPAYVGGWVLLLAGLTATEHWLWVAAFMASCWVSLAPAWLIEFRYFTTPFVLAMLHLPVPPRSLSLLVCVGYCCVNALTLWVFAKRPYTWGDGSTARFMW